MKANTTILIILLSAILINKSDAQQKEKALESSKKDTSVVKGVVTKQPASSPDTATVKIFFANTKETIRRKDSSLLFPIVLKIDSIKIQKDSLKLYSVTIKVDETKSSLAKIDYKIDFSTVPLDKFSSDYTAFLTIKPDSISDRDRHLFLGIEIAKSGKKVGINTATHNTTLDITIESVRAINNYNYLGYVGTNFDLIDGVKAKDLFFAVNIFAPPVQKEEKFGFSLTLYGNRTLTLTDTVGRISYPSRIIPVTDTTALRVNESAIQTVTRVTDNLGASFSPLLRLNTLPFIKIKKKSIAPNFTLTDLATKVYYAPQFELVWRRIRVNTTYSSRMPADTLTGPYTRATGPITITPPGNSTNILNAYDAYLGVLGFLLEHQNDHISV